jgi:hypothetical protein
MANYVMGRKMSRAATYHCEDDENGEWYFILEGSANDILKGIKEAELNGYTPYYSEPVILRTGRRYRLVMDYYDRFWHVARVA